MHACVSNATGVGDLVRARWSSSLEAGSISSKAEKGYTQWEASNRGSATESVNLVTLDGVLHQAGLVAGMRERPVGFLKIDVQGHEPSVLKGAIRTINRWHPFVQYEDEKLPAASKGGQLFRSLLPDASDVYRACTCKCVPCASPPQPRTQA